MKSNHLSPSLACIFIALSLLLTSACNGQEGPLTTPTQKDSASAKTQSATTNQTVDGKKEGLWKVYQENGKLKSEGSYQAGVKEGMHKSWEEDGTLIEEVEYLTGKETGLTTWYHPGGHVAGSGQMVNGVRQGAWKICDIDESGFCIDAFFKDGQRDGVWKIYHDKTNSNVWKEQTFKDDRVVEEKCWDENGVLIACE